MFVKEFFFSFLLLAFAALLMLGGVALLVDASRRLVRDAYRRLRQAEAALKPVAPVQASEKITTFEQAA